MQFINRRRVLQLAASAAIARALPALGKVSVSTSWDDADATAMAQWVARGDVHPRELLEQALARLRQVNPKLNLLAQDHIEIAFQTISRELPKGPFTGIPFLLKDLGIQLAGTVTSGGSTLMKDIVAKQDSTLVSRYKQAGVVIFGKTNTPEFGMALTTEGRHLGDCRNPWNSHFSTGGSSGGAAAAVSTGVVPIAHGTDGGGSIRVPANHCGVFGFKPTRGLTPGASGAGMSVGHVLTRSVRDSAIMLEATAGYEMGAPYGANLPKTGFLAATMTPPRPLRIALNVSEPAVFLHPDVERSVYAAAKLLQSLGHEVEEAAPGIDYEWLNETQNTLMVSAMASWLDYIEATRGLLIAESDLEPMSHMIWRTGKSLRGTQVAAALESMHELGRIMGRFHRRYDAVLQPVTATPAPPLGTITYRDGDDLDSYTDRFKQVAAFTHLYNMTGQPSMSVPLGMSANGLPIGVMLSAAVANDALLFALAAQLERAEPWFHRRPPIIQELAV